MYRFFCFLFVLAFFSSCNREKPKSTRVEEIENSPVQQPEEENFQSLINELEAPDREQWQQPELILEYLGDLRGKKVADIGAGTGYFSFKIAREADLVLAIDIDKRFIEYIEEHKQDLQGNIGKNVVAKLALPDDPLLADDEMDAVLLVNTYHFIQNRVNYLKKVKKGIRSGGIILIVDFNPGESPVGPSDNNRVSSEKAISELENAGFRKVFVDKKSLPYQYIVKAIAP